MHKVKISNHGVEIDGVNIPNVTSISLHMDSTRVSELVITTVEFSGDIEFDGEVKDVIMNRNIFTENREVNAKDN